MRAFRLSVGVLIALFLALSASAANFAEKWVYSMPDLSKDDSVETLIKTMRDAKGLGCTHILIKDPQLGFLGMKDEHFFANAKRVRDAAAEIGIAVIPTVYPFGYSGGYLVQDPNLAAGLPARRAPFVVKNGLAKPDPASAPNVANAGFDWVTDNQPDGWVGNGEYLSSDAKMVMVPADLPAPFAVADEVTARPEEIAGKKPAGWTAVSGVRFISSDTTVMHSGGASLKFSGFVAQPAMDSSALRVRGMESTDGRMRMRGLDSTGAGAPRSPTMQRTGPRSPRLESTGEFGGGRRQRSGVVLRQMIDVTPFQYYRLTVWVKTDNLRFHEFAVGLSSQGGRRHCYTNIPAPAATQDWQQVQLTFNTLEATQIELSLSLNGATAGTMWLDDLKIEPAGLANVLRRPAKPFRVTSADGKVVYEEGKDFQPVADPLLGKAPARQYFEHFPFDVWHPGPGIVLTPDSHIKDGDRILVSFYHPQIIYDEQVIVSMVDPKVFELMEDQVKRVVDLWHAPGYTMNYDEIRIEGWEVSPDGKTYTPGQILARNTARGIEILRKYAPDAAIYTWSDMYDPNHNARDWGVYYLVNGNYAGSWESLPSDVTILTWIASPRTIKWFADRGHKQILCGYYDSPAVENNVTRWLSASQGMPGIVGMMYTTWTNNFSDMDRFFTALKAAEPSAGAAYQGRDETVPRTDR